MIEVKKIGKYFTLDDENTIENVAHVAKVETIWADVLNDIVEKYHASYPNQIHSIYLRGSVAAGYAVPHFSDIDTFALIHTPDEYIRWKEVSWSADYIKEMQEKYDFVRHIDLNVSSFRENMYEANPKLAMVIKTQACCLFGESVIDTIPGFKIGADMILDLRWLADDLSAFSALQPTDADYQKKSAEIIKVIIRCGFELVMERVNKYTKSLYHCQLEFGSVYPEKSEKMKRLLFFFLNPTLCGTESQDLIHELGQFILVESRDMDFQKPSN